MIFCAARPYYIDEAYTFNLATDRSLAHMLLALKEGADGSFPLFGIFVFVWDKICGSSELSLRLAGGIFVIFLIVHSGQRLTERFTAGPAALALLVILANQKILFYAIQARFYGLLLFAFSLTFWTTWDLIESRTVSGKRRLLHAFFCGLLWLSHPLGMIYGSILLFLYVGFSLFRKTFSPANTVAFLGGPLFFLLWLPSFLVQQKINVVFPPGAYVYGWQKYPEYLFLASTTFGIVSVLGLVLFAAAHWKRPVSAGGEISTAAKSQHLTSLPLVSYAVAFIVTLNVAVALLDASGAIHIYLMQAVRYVLVAAVAYGVVFAATFEQLDLMVRSVFRPRWAGIASRALQSAGAIFLVFVLGTTWNDWMNQRSGRDAYLTRVAALAREKQLDLFCDNHIDAFFLATRTPATGVKYFLADNFPFRALMLQMHRYYPQPTPMGLAEFQHPNGDVVLVPAFGKVTVVTNGNKSQSFH